MASFALAPVLGLLSLHLLLLLSLPALSSGADAHLARKLLFSDDEDGDLLPPPPPKKKTSAAGAAAAKSPTATSSDGAAAKDQTKPPKPAKTKKDNSTSAAAKLLKPFNSTKLLKPTNSSTKPLKPPKSTNSTAAAKLPKSPKALNSTIADGAKLSKKLSDLDLSKPNKTKSATPKSKQKQPPPQKQQSSKAKPNSSPLLPWFDSAGDVPSEETDLIAEFRDLPSRFQQTLLPDLEKISTTSKVYLSHANREITRGVKPLVGNRYAPTVASVTSAVFLVLPLLLVAALLHQVRTYLSLPRILLFVHAYLAIYFSILSLIAALTGLEPLRLFYATSPGPYVYTQVLQTLGYVLFLLLQLMHLVVVFATPASALPSPDGTSAARALALFQLVVGMAVGLHYHTAVFHRAVVGEPPRTNWRVHGLYAACFLAICAFARAAERRKKAYLLGGPGGDVGKKS